MKNDNRSRDQYGRLGRPYAIGELVEIGPSWLGIIVGCKHPDRKKHNKYNYDWLVWDGECTSWQMAINIRTLK